MKLTTIVIHSTRKSSHESKSIHVLIDTGGELNCNIITDKIAQIVRTRSGGYVDLGSNGFKIYTSEIESISYVEDDMNDKTYFRSIMELSNRVFQQ